MFLAKRSAESHSRPGKRSAAGEDTSGAIPAFVPDGGFALSGLRHPPVSPYTVGPASAAPPGRNLRRHTRLCAGWRYAYPAYGILP
ncbi:hypothetical protein KU660_22275 [Klebsiella africana]|uniref:Uncharacterized protein n=1 Tax=Klebsiella africana TaxID=2489010 RepID=A0ACD4ALT7_9ENTR|nr:hypothetical protein [Klebsiella africana]UDD39877.1 hypothetical protein LGL98_22305 [Klebsiella africana]USB40675.1 hypothetical protein KU660_22275 [Klebsiella africana]